MFETAFDIYKKRMGRMISPSINSKYLIFKSCPCLSIQARTGVKTRKPRPLLSIFSQVSYLFIYFVLPRQN